MSNSMFKKPTGGTHQSLTSAMSDNPGTRDSSVETLEVHKSRLFPDPDQPRKNFPFEVLEERKNQMIKNGQESPLTVLPPITAEDGELSYQIHDGECRWRSSNLTDEFEYLRVEIYRGDASNPIEKLCSQLLHNDDGSEELNPIERAAAFRRLVEMFEDQGSESPINDVAEQLGKDPAEVSRVVGLTEMPQKVLDFALANGIGDVKALSGIKRIAMKGTEEQLSNLLTEVKDNLDEKAEGGISRPLRDIVKDSVATIKSKSPKEKKGAKSSKKTSDKKQRLLSAKIVTMTVKGDGGFLMIETPRETFKINLTTEQINDLKSGS